MSNYVEKVKRMRKIATLNYQINSLYLHLYQGAHFMTTEHINRVYEHIASLEAELKMVKEGAKC